MSTKQVGNYGYQYLTDFSAYPAEVGGSSMKRKIAFPVILQSAITRTQERKASEMIQHAGTMSKNGLLERPGVRPHADLTLADANARLAMEGLFISSLNLVLTVGNHVIQKEISTLYAKTQTINTKAQTLRLKIKDIDEAAAKAEKSAYAALLMRWVAVAVTAVACAADRQMKAQEPSFEAVALCLCALADDFSAESGLMQHSVQAIAGLLRKMGFGDKSADMMAGILAAVVAMAALTTSRGTGKEFSIPAAAVTITENVTWAAQLAAKDAEAACEAVCLADSCNGVVDRLRKKETVAMQSQSPGTPEQGNGLVAAFMNDDLSGSHPIREEMMRYLQDIMASTRRTINQSLPHC